MKNTSSLNTSGILFPFLAQPSQRLKWAFLIEIYPLSVVAVIVLNFHIFINFSKTSQSISTKLGIKHSLVKKIRVTFIQIKGHTLFIEEIIMTNWIYIEYTIKSSQEPLVQFHANMKFWRVTKWWKGSNLFK